MFRKQFLIFILILPFFGQAQEIDILILNRDFDKALEKIDYQLSRDPSAKLYFKKSMVHQQLMDYPAALEDLNQALLLDSANIDYLTARAGISQSMGNNSIAIKDFQQAVKINPSNLVLKYELGKTYLRLSDFRTAFKTFEEIQAVDSTNLMFNKFSALAAYKASENERAVHLYQKYLSQNPDDLSAYINLAAAYSKLKKQNDCWSTLSMAHHKFPNNRSVHLKFANTLFTSKRYALAQRYYHTYMAKHDTLLPVYMNYGICLYHNKDTEGAIEVLEDCYSMSPNDTYINFYLGAAHKRLKQNELAEKYLNFAIYISIPDFHPEMYHHLAQVYGRQRKFEKSIECYKKAYELDNRKIGVLFEIATTYEEFNYKSVEALAYYRSYLKEAGEGGEHVDYALGRIKLIQEELFMNE